MTPIVHVDRRKRFTSNTLPPDALMRLETAFRSAGWWRDRWRCGKFRKASRDILREYGGLVLIGPGMPFGVPPPFDEMFEPIEIAGGLGTNRRQLTTLSGEKRTRQERFMWIAWLAVGLCIVAMGVPVFLVIVRGIRADAALMLMAVFAGCAATIAAVLWLRRLSGRWYLVPGAIAMVRRPPRRGQEARITVLSRKDTCLLLRYVSTGKTTVLMLELWPHAGKRFQRSVSEREAISVLASWQSAQPPPPDERLKELIW